MERKIGEIFEYNGEWYQCIENENCRLCSFYELDCKKVETCIKDLRTDKKFVIYKKLEKVGEPFADYCPSARIIYFQKYICYQKPVYNGDLIYCLDNNFISIEIKNKEDMKTVKISKDDLNFLIDKIRYGILPKHIDYDKITNEISKLFSIDNIEDSNSESIGKNLKPFDLEAAKAGKPVCTKDGRPARIICFDRVTNSTNEYTGHLIVLVTNPNGDEQSFYYTEKGNLAGEDEYDNHKWDLMMLHEKKEGWINLYWEDGMIEDCTCVPYATREEALDNISDPRFVTTVKIEWEE